MSTRKYKKVRRHVRGHKRRDARTGKKVDVEPYTRQQKMRGYRKIPRAKAKELFEQRPQRAKTIDKQHQAKTMKEDPDEEWAENISRIDAEGIDTPFSSMKEIIDEQGYKNQYFYRYYNNTVPAHITVDEMYRNFEYFVSSLQYNYAKHQDKNAEAALRGLSTFSNNLYKQGVIERLDSPEGADIRIPDANIYIKVYNPRIFFDSLGLYEYSEKIPVSYSSHKSQSRSTPIIKRRPQTEREKVKTLEDVGGKHWEKYGKNRVYFNGPDLAVLLGYTWTNYKTGNISSAKKNDEKISNTKMRKILDDLNSGVYYDVDTNKFNYKTGIGTGQLHTEKAIEALQKELQKESVIVK